NWPPAEAAFTDWFLTAGGALADAGDGAEAAIPFRTDGPGLRFERRIAEDTDICGPMALTLDLVTDDLDDVNLFAGVRLIRNGRPVGFEGAFGFGLDLVARGCLKASMRALDVERSAPGQPAYHFTGREPLTPGVPVTLIIELLPSATRFRVGDIFRLDLRGAPFFRRHPLLGQFPFAYQPSRPGTVRVLVGGRRQARLTVPVLARRMAD
ncbi:MAG: CocE/NonD family hydrolase C-terminal non-catalytic domain-containing protein, partial [Rhodospirillaceae bacterium]